MTNERLLAVIDYFKSVKQGHIGSGLTMEQMLQLIRKQIPAGSFSHYWNQQDGLRETLARELVQTTVALWSRYPVNAFADELLNLALLVYPFQEGRQSDKELNRLYLVLSEIYDTIRPAKGISEQGRITLPDKLVSLLDHLMPLELCTRICKSRGRWDFNWRIQHLLVRVLHYTRREEPLASLQFIEKRAIAWRWDPAFEEKLDRLEVRLLSSLQKPVYASSWQTNWSAPPQRDPLERVTFAQQVQDGMLRFRAFLFDTETAGPNRLVQLFMVSVLLLAFSFITYQSMNMMVTAHKVEHVINYDYMERSRRTTPNYVRFKSKYEGNQLQNGSHPFSRCFDEGLYDYGSGNQLILTNPTDFDAIACVYAPDSTNKKIARHIYLRAGARQTLHHLPEGAYTLRYYLGKDWNPIKPNFCGLHGAFDTRPHYLKLSRKEGTLEFTNNTSHSLRLAPDEADGKHFIEISASAFFSNRNRGLPLK